MTHAPPLVATLVAAVTAALAFGMLARAVRLSPLVGYLLAGVAIGPHVPGMPTADAGMAAELAEIGVILLLFKVGLKLSAREIAEVRTVAAPGALVAMAVPATLGWALARFGFGWSDIAGLVFGLSLSVASTVVLLRAYTDHDLLKSEAGHLGVGWLVVEDAAMVLALVLVPVAADLLSGVSGPKAPNGGEIALAVAATVGKAFVFVALMLGVGRQVLPWLLKRIAASGSAEMFNLGTLATALGIAYVAAAMFGVSFALGAFLAGLALAGSPLSQKAAEHVLPLRDAFAVLFFVSVGMLFNPAIVVERPLALAATVSIILVGKAAAVWAWMRLCGYGRSTTAVLAAGLAQIGEFSFILSALGVRTGLLPQEGRELVLAAALILIAVNPFFLAWARRRTSAVPPQAAATGNESAEAAIAPAA